MDILTKRFTYRLLALTSDQIRELSESSPGVRVRPHWRRPNLFVATIPLRDEKDCDLARQVATVLCPEHIDHDVFVSITTESDTIIVDVPGFILTFVSEIGCGISFSCTLLTPAPLLEA